MTDLKITDLPSLGAALRAMAKSLGLSPTALLGDNGSTLIGVATGTATKGDLSLGPIMRVFARAGWELVFRPAKGDGIVVSREGTGALKVVGADGGPIEISVGSMEELARAIRTMALANDKAVSRMIKDAGTNSTALVSFATGSAGHKDLRLLNLLRTTTSAQFALYARPRFRNRREARLRAQGGATQLARTEAEVGTVTQETEVRGQLVDQLRVEVGQFLPQH